MTENETSPEENPPSETASDWQKVVVHNATNFPLLDEMQAEFRKDRPNDLQEFKRLRGQALKYRLRGNLVWDSSQGTYINSNRKEKKQRAADRKVARKAHRRLLKAQ